MLKSERSKWIFYRVLQILCRTIGLFFIGYRVDGRKNAPPTGGLLICANHQSYLDPVLVGMAIDRKVHYLARASLFRNFLFAALIRSLDAIPLERGGASALRGMLETAKRLRDGNAVLIFPEGSRTYDGHMMPLQPGFVSLARRAQSPILPVAIAGAYESWPRHGAPWMRRIHVSIGKPIPFAEIESLDDAGLINRVAQELQTLLTQAEHRRREEGASAPAVTTPQPAAASA
jgi:1-acyl-sn-glycerol-3-phosphate acyltransferase